MDESFDYRPLKENENYFENTEKYHCGISHIRNNGMGYFTPGLLEFIDSSLQKENRSMASFFDDDVDKDDPYGLAHVSTTTLKKELRRRKGKDNEKSK